MRMRLRAEQDWKIDHNGKCDTKSLWNKANQEGKLNCSIIVFLFVAGPESVPPSLLKVVMKPIATVGENYQYPPVNWASVLSPLMRLNFGKHQVFLGLWSLILGCDLDRKIYPVSQVALTWEVDLQDFEVWLLWWDHWITFTGHFVNSWGWRGGGLKTHMQEGALIKITRDWDVLGVGHVLQATQSWVGCLSSCTLRALCFREVAGGMLQQGSVAAVTNYHTLSGLNQRRFIFLSYSSVDHKSNIVLSGLISRYGQSSIIS